MGGKEEPTGLEGLVFRAMRAGWIYGYMEGCAEIVCLLKTKRSKRLVLKHFNNELRNKNKRYELSICCFPWNTNPNKDLPFPDPVKQYYQYRHQ